MGIIIKHTRKKDKNKKLQHWPRTHLLFEGFPVELHFYYRMAAHMAKFDEIIQQSLPGDPYVFKALLVDYGNHIYRLTNLILGDP